MDTARKAYAKTLTINHFSPDNVPWRRIGQYLYRVIEDGSTTQMRLAAIESLLPPRTTGPVFHFHEMHDEGFLIKTGRVRFHSPGRPDVDAKAGDWVTIPIRLPHRFSNPFDEETIFVNINTPGFFVRYFEHLEELIGEGRELTPEVNRAALMRFATVPLANEAVEELEEEAKALREGKGEVVVNGGAEKMNGVPEVAKKEEVNGHADMTNGTIETFAEKGKSGGNELDLAANGGTGVSEYGGTV